MTSVLTTVISVAGFKYLISQEQSARAGDDSNEVLFASNIKTTS